MAQGDPIFMVEINHVFGFKGSSIVYDYFPRTAESGQYVSLKVFNNDRVSSIPSGYGLYPFGKIICGCEDPFMLV